MPALDPNSGGGQIFGYNIEGLAPQGQVIATCLDIRNQFQVDRKKFQSEENEKQDVTRFLFGFVGTDGRMYLAQTFEFKISGNSGGNLVAFLKAWTSRDPYGWDYDTLKGTGAMITVGVKQSRKNPGKWYNTVDAISPVYPTLQAQIPQAGQFAQLLAKALTQPEQQQQNRPNTPPPAGGAPPPTAPPAAPGGFAPPAGAPPGYPQPPAPPAPPVSRKFWIVGAPGQPAVEGTQDQIQKAVNSGRTGLLVCPLDAPQTGWVDPGAVGILLQAPPQQPVAPPMPPGMPSTPPPPPPQSNPAWPQPPQQAWQHPLDQPPTQPSPFPPGHSAPGMQTGGGMPPVAPPQPPQPPAPYGGKQEDDDIPF